MNEKQRKILNTINEETDKVYHPTKVQDETLLEYLKWRSEDNNKSVVLMIEYLALFGLLIILGILVLNLVGIIPHTEITKVCTLVETVNGVI